MFSPQSRRRPSCVVLDVNETLSDMRGLRPYFEEVGADPALQQTWFAATLRDGFAITAAGGYRDFAEIAVSTLQALLSGSDSLRVDARAAAEHVVSAMAELELHDDVAAGLHRLHESDVHVVTLSNGDSAVADSLLRRAGLRALVGECLSVSDSKRWKPAPEAYLRVAQRLRLDPHELALIAVHPWDIDGSLRAGLRAAWLARDGESYPPFMRAPERSAANLPALASKLCETT